MIKNTIVLYCFHTVNDNVNHFIKNALFDDPDVDFMFICNNPTIKVNVPPYVTVMHRENKGYDFGAWSDAVLTHNLVDKYKRFIFVNSSVIGPYIKGRWTDHFLNGLKDNVKLFGCTINAMRDPIYKSHVQSYLFCMDDHTLSFLIKKGIFSYTYTRSFNHTIQFKEVLMSRLLIDNGWNIGSMLPYYKGIDFTFKDKSLTKHFAFMPNIMTQEYKDRLWTKEQLIFIKGNRIDCGKNCKKSKRGKKLRITRKIKLPKYLK